MEASKNEPTLQRGLQTAISEAICAGRRHWHRTVSLSARSDSNGGPVLLGHGVAGYRFIMRQLGEMVGRAGFRIVCPLRLEILGAVCAFVGWNYWVMFVLVGMAELTAAGIYMQYWLPDVPTWVWAARFWLSLMPNLVNVRLYGETEFWFALIKVLAIIGMIGFGSWLPFSGHGGEHSIDNLLGYNGFFATG